MKQQNDAPPGCALAFFGVATIIALASGVAIVAAVYFGTDALCAWLDEDSTAAICEMVR